MPEGVSVATYHHATYLSLHHFQLSDIFIPERWLGQDSRFKSDKLECVQPFGLGSRGCIGKAYVLLSEIDKLLLLMY